MSDDDDDQPSSAEPEQPPRRGPVVVRFTPPRWLMVPVVVGWMLAIRTEMTTDYVARGKLEPIAIGVTFLFGLAGASLFVLRRRPEDVTPPPRAAVLGRFVVMMFIATTTTAPPFFGYVALLNRVGRVDDVVRVRCTATRLESRIRLRGGRGAVVHYTCAMPDGQRLFGHAREVMPAELGKPLVIPAARGRLGVWIRTGAPEPVATLEP